MNIDSREGSMPFRDGLDDCGPFRTDSKTIRGVFYIAAGIYRTIVAGFKDGSNMEVAVGCISHLGSPHDFVDAIRLHCN
jgi:hypothetical protein